MQLTVREAAKLLAVSERTVQRGVREGSLPSHRVNNQVRVNRAELVAWATAGQLSVAPELLSEAGNRPESLPSVVEALTQGGVHAGIVATDKAAAIQAVVERLTLPKRLDRGNLARILLAREALGSTGIGDGIAVPHVRNPIILHAVAPAIAVCYLAQPIDFAAIDGQPVQTMFILLSPSVPIHLHLLSRLSFMLRNPDFRTALAQRAPGPAIIEAARRAEVGLQPAPSTSTP
jgi:nitrogen PTS system EIIA component